MAIGIIGAMKEEVDAFLSKIEVSNEKVVANCKFYEGKLINQDVIVLQSGIGKVNAALSTTILHEQYNIDAVINTGSAGGTDKNLNVGDVVPSVNQSFIMMQMQLHSVMKYGQIPQMPHLFKSDQRLINLAKRSCI